MRHRTYYKKTSGLKSRLILAAVICLSVVRQSNLYAESVNLNVWQTISDDLEFFQYNPDKNSIISKEIYFFRTSLKKYAPKALFQENFLNSSAKGICLKKDASLCVNANFFDEFRKPLGLVADSGKIAHPVHKGGSLLNGILLLSSNKMQIIPRKNFSAERTTMAVQSGPLLLLNGKPYSKLKSPTKESRRAGVCIDHKDRLLIFCSASEYSGPSLSQLISILSLPAINCRDALNFDGGSSAQLYVNSKKLNLQKKMTEHLAGQSPVPVVFALVNK